MLIRKFVIANWLAVIVCWPGAWEMSVWTRKQRLQTISSGHNIGFKIFCMGRHGERNSVMDGQIS